MSSNISPRLETFDRVTGCIPVVSTVTNTVHLLAMVIMKVLEKCFGVQIFGKDYTEFLENRRPWMYASVIPVLGNCAVGAWLLFGRSADDDEEIYDTPFTGLQGDFEFQHITLLRAAEKKLRKLQLSIINNKHAQQRILKVATDLLGFLEKLFFTNFDHFQELMQTCKQPGSHPLKCMNQTIESFYKVAMLTLTLKQEPMLPSQILGDDVASNLKNYKDHWNALLEKIQATAQ